MIPLALTVAQMLGDHGTMQVEEDGIDRQGGAQVGEQPADDALEGILGGPAGRRCAGWRYLICRLGRQPGG